MYPFHDGAIPGFQAAANGLMPNANANDSISSEAAVAMAAVMNLRQQQLNAANQHQSDSDMPSFNLPSPQMRSGISKTSRCGVCSYNLIDREIVAFTTNYNLLGDESSPIIFA